jgi:hypothetical protein
MTEINVLHDFLTVTINVGKHPSDEKIREIHEKVKLIEKKYACCKSGNLHHYNGICWKQCENLSSLIELDFDEHNTEKLFSIEFDMRSFVHRNQVSQKSESVKFDEHKNLICFRNKLYDINEHKFIEPKPEYYVKKCLSYNYTNHPDEYEKYSKKVNDFIDTLFPIETEKIIFMTLIANAVSGKLRDMVFVLYGSGHNGKSAFLNMLTTTFSCDVFYDEIVRNKVEFSSLIDEHFSKKRKHVLCIHYNGNNFPFSDKKIIPIHFRNDYSKDEHFKSEFYGEKLIDMWTNGRSAFFDNVMSYHK